MHRHSNRIHPVFALFFSTIILLAATADAQTFFPASQRLISISPPSLEGETALDYDNDGALDLMMGRNQLLLFTNNGDGAFTDATARTGVIDQFQFLPTLASDFNGDGFLDIVAKGLRSR